MTIVTTTRVQRIGRADGYVKATLRKEYDVVRAFNARLAMHDVAESDRAEYAAAFCLAFEAEAARKAGDS
jgi:hypothetical protein